MTILRPKTTFYKGQIRQILPPVPHDPSKGVSLNDRSEAIVEMLLSYEEYQMRRYIFQNRQVVNDAIRREKEAFNMVNDKFAYRFVIGGMCEDIRNAKRNTINCGPVSPITNLKN